MVYKNKTQLEYSGTKTISPGQDYRVRNNSFVKYLMYMVNIIVLQIMFFYTNKANEFLVLNALKTKPYVVAGVLLHLLEPLSDLFIMHRDAKQENSEIS